MKGILYGVSVGPGDPELMTIKAINTIKNSDIIVVPKSDKSERVALNIAIKMVPEIINKELIELYMPMSRDKELLKRCHEEAAKKIISLLDSEKNVAFLTLGDVSIYSTYNYIGDIVKNKGYKSVMIAGVPSFCAVASTLNISLTEAGKPIHIIPASYDGIDSNLKIRGTKVLMKAGKSMPKIKMCLKKYNIYENAKAVERCGMDEERIYNSLDEINEDASYFSIIIATDKEEVL
jgi:precorrin-2/cobalt-factor-2 C20-methyltransferase